MVRYELAIKEAARILKENGIEESPVDVKKIAEKLDIKVIVKNLEGTMSGAAFRKDGKPVIVVNKDDISARQRFTMAHELGHLLLHRNTDLHVDSHNPILFRDHESSAGTDEKEMEANRFAAELLMPESWLRRDIEKSNLDLCEDGWIEDLASLYGVSKQALIVRLSSLGMITLY